MRLSSSASEFSLVSRTDFKSRRWNYTVHPTSETVHPTSETRHFIAFNFSLFSPLFTMVKLYNKPEFRKTTSKTSAFEVKNFIQKKNLVHCLLVYFYVKLSKHYKKRRKASCSCTRINKYRAS